MRIGEAQHAVVAVEQVVEPFGFDIDRLRRDLVVDQPVNHPVIGGRDSPCDPEPGDTRDGQRGVLFDPQRGAVHDLVVGPGNRFLQQQADAFLPTGQLAHRDRAGVFGTGEASVLSGFGDHAVSFRERRAELHFGVPVVETEVFDGEFQFEARRSVAVVEQYGVESDDVARRQIESDGGFAEFDLGILRIVVGRTCRGKRNIEPGFRKAGLSDTYFAGHVHADLAGVPCHVVSGVVDRNLVVVLDVDDIPGRDDSRSERQGQLVADRRVVRVQIGQIVLLVDTRILACENCEDGNPAGASEHVYHVVRR